MSRCSNSDCDRILHDVGNDVCDTCYAAVNDDYAVQQAIDLLSKTGRYSVKDNETGEWT